MPSGLVRVVLPVFPLLAAFAVSPVTDTLTITGTVKSEQGMNLVGANVYITEMNVSVGTNDQGAYRIVLARERVRGQAVQLRVRAIGFQPQAREVRLTGDSIRADFVLRIDMNRLQEVVVTGVTGATETKKLGFTVAPFAPAADEATQGLRGWRGEREHNTESYDRIDDNPFLGARENPLSTFSIDVDRASYSNIRRFVTQGQRPPKDAVRIEELLNYFTYDYPEPSGAHPFSVTTEVAPAPWQPMHHLVRIGLQARRIAAESLPPSNLVFLIDVSGSMRMPNKLSLIKRALPLLVEQLREQDRVAIVVYAGAAGVVLPPTSGDRKAEILAALERLEAGGSTAGGAGIRLAYDVARRYHLPEGNNRVILSTDGDFNVGASSDAEMERLIEEKRQQGTFLSVLGFGMGNLKDSKMEKLADKGNGTYAYIDGIAEARKVLVEEMGGTLLTVAKDVKLQVEFNPAQVAAYRLIGYENRMLRSEDFDDDAKDAGEMGAGHSVTALYEVVPVGVESPVLVRGQGALRYQRPGPAPIAPAAVAARQRELLFVKLRYKLPKADVSRRFDHVVGLPGESGARASTDLRFAAAVAAFGMVLRESEHKGTATLDDAIAIARGALGLDRGGYRQDFIRLAESVRDRRLLVATQR